MGTLDEHHLHRRHAPRPISWRAIRSAAVRDSSAGLAPVQNRCERANPLSHVRPSEVRNG